MPLVGSMGKSKKSKDGGSAAYDGGVIWALKGGNTQEFWTYTIATNTWAERETMPAFGSTGKKKRVKAGGDICSYGGGVFFALKGNKTNELWRYVAATAAGTGLPERSGVMAERRDLGPQGMALAPNPVVGGHAVLSYSLAAAGPVTVRMYDVTGRNVLSRTVAAGRAGRTGLDLRELSAGVYLVNLEANGYRATRKLVVQ
jgi:hypothetical protein